MLNSAGISPRAATLLSGRAGGLLIVVLGFLCSLAVMGASLKHTGSLGFPLDDGYIYSNYVLNASQGHFFTYNLGETSGGITGLGWYLLLVLCYFLLSPFSGSLGGLSTATVRANPILADQAAHLYLAASFAGTLCLIATGLGVWKLADLCLPAGERRPTMRALLCWLLGAVAVADLGLLWGADSGLEVALSAAFSVWALASLIADQRRGRLGWSLLLCAALPWARPDLAVFGVAGVLWLLLMSVVNRDAGLRRRNLMMAGSYLAAGTVGFGAMSLVYFVGWGRPLPSSFYAKVGGLRFGMRFFSATEELLIAGRSLPFVAALIAVAGGVAGLVEGRTRQAGQANSANDTTRRAAGLLLLSFVLYIAAIMFTLSWFGQEDRYLLPAHPVAIVLIGILVWRLIARVPLERPASQRLVQGVFAALACLALLGTDYLWATRDYVVEVRNIVDGQIAPAVWLAAHEPPSTVVASEPIGAVKLFSGMRTIDLVGLTTPATLGTYRNWPLAWPALRSENADVLLFYPAWFDGGHPPAWAHLQQQFTIPDNRIVGDSPIAIYRLDWQSYKP